MARNLCDEQEDEEVLIRHLRDFFNPPFCRYAARNRAPSSRGEHGWRIDPVHELQEDSVYVIGEEIVKEYNHEAQH
ncbi:MAG TPA: hypothetical protein VJK03_04870 [Candidatus Nanoarchaeia archaeon]|nr:hypothetical protein [Candidatus Nanoarchaeia archaeon]